MNIDFLKATLQMQPTPGAPTSKYIFVVESDDLALSLCALTTHGIAVNKDGITLDEFINALQSIVPGKTNVMDFTFALALNKRNNERLSKVLKECCYSYVEAWRVFYKREYLLKASNFEQLKQAVEDFVNQHEGKCTSVSCVQDVRNMLACKIDYDKDGNVKGRKTQQTIRNIELVLDNDPRFAGKIKFDEFSKQTYLLGSVPWENIENYRVWSNMDDSALLAIIQSEYDLHNEKDYFHALRNVSRRSRFHQVKDVLETFVWDGKEHIRNLLPDFLGVEDSEYTYNVMRLFMLGAVARVYQPGCKFDYTMILQGAQGIGKSSFLHILALNDEWFNDSLDSLDSDKSVQALAGTWIVELAELKSLARTAGGVDSVKRFLTATQDKTRIPYERRAEIFLRQCVFAGTTNKTDFLQDETGNRRFLIIQTGENEPKRNLFEASTLDEIKQAWAQAVHIWKNEHPVLVLPESCRAEAEALQNASTADDGKIGIIEEYLKDKQRVCAIQIWQEALGEEGRPQKWQATEINDIVSRMSDWARTKSTSTFGKYGKQRGFYRKSTIRQQQIGKSHQEFEPLSEEYRGRSPFD